MPQVDEHGYDKEPKSADYTEASFKYVYDSLMKTKEKNSNELCIEWFPGYGCAIIFHRAKNQWSTNLSIDVIGLDNHEFKVHVGQRKYQNTAVSNSFSVLSVGQINVNDKSSFYDRFQKVLQKTSKKVGNDRSAEGGKQGHQRTPAFIHAILNQVLIGGYKSNEVYQCKDVLPIGGFTDVGLHTGGQKRDTCYSLASSVFKFLFKTNSFDPVMAHFHMHLLEKMILEIDVIDTGFAKQENLIAPNPKINFIFHSLKHLSLICAHLSENDYQLQDFYDKMKAFRVKINMSLKKFDSANLEKNSLAGSKFQPYNPSIELPAFRPPQTAEQMTPEALQGLIEENIGQFLSPSPKDNIERSVLWATKMKGEIKQSNTKLFIFLRRIESVFWHISEQNFETSPLSISVIDGIMSLVDDYRAAVHIYSQQNSEILNRVRCVELLLVWVSYCAVFNAMIHVHDDMKGFGVALKYKDLKHLLLHDTTHLIVLERVARFLNAHTVDDKDLFSTKEEEENWTSPTFEMGEMYAKRHFESIWLKEKKDADHRTKKHWEEVVRKQDLARKLRRELGQLESDLSYELPKMNDYDSHGYRTSRGKRAQEAVDHLRSRISSKETEITEAEKAPPAIIQPIPKCKHKARKVIFFLYMPNEFQYLSHLTFTAQQLLVPKPWSNLCIESRNDGDEVFRTLKVNKEIHCWKHHYDENQKCTHHRPAETRTGEKLYVSLSMHTDAPNRNRIGPCHVDHFSCQSDGVWYPDLSNIRMVWKGGKFNWDHHKSEGEFNPFKIKGDFAGKKKLGKIVSSSHTLVITLGD